MNNFQPPYYFYRTNEELQGIFQIDTELNDVMIRRKRPTLPESILRLAHKEYETQSRSLSGTSQSYEDMQKRGGLSVLEIIRLLADHVERLQNIVVDK